MTHQTKSPHRSIAALNLSRSVPALIVQARSIVQAMTKNPSFPSPAPPLPAVTDAIQTLQTAETATLSRTVGAASARDEKRDALVRQLAQLRNHVQTAADADLDAAASVIESAGLALRRARGPSPRVFGATWGPVSGSVTLVTERVSRRASYDWQYSPDAGKTWISVPSTLTTKTTITGLPPGATVFFRSRPLTKEGVGDWSQPASLTVV